MRLIHTKTLELDEFFGGNIPPYAILSHTWEKDEVSFQDMNGDHAGLTGKAGYVKIQKSCLIAAEDGFEYIWIDTCCIDKTSSSELSEAINSMYRWYGNCDVCYACLTDVYEIPKMENDLVTFTSTAQFRSSRWFKRGWTLQELIAPLSLIFYSAEWEVLGTKSSLKRIISDVTGIQLELFSGTPIGSFSVAQRMSWASERETSREEDIAYSLMGIFGVHMPMLYGEGASAFQRLQEEIIRKSDDHTIFAWGVESRTKSLASVFSRHPFQFKFSRTIVCSKTATTGTGPFSMTNKGLRLELPVIDDRSISSVLPSDNTLYFDCLYRHFIILDCTDSNKPGSVVGIPVSLSDERTRTYMRYNFCIFFGGVSIADKRLREARERPIFLKSLDSWHLSGRFSSGSMGLLVKPENLAANGIMITQTFPRSQLQQSGSVLLATEFLESCSLRLVKDEYKYFIIFFKILFSGNLDASVRLCSRADCLKEAVINEAFSEEQIDTTGLKVSDASDVRWWYPGENWGVRMNVRKTLVDGKRILSVAISAISMIY